MRMLAGVVLAAVACAQAPRIDAVDPLQGPLAGGTLVTLRGANLTGTLRLDDVLVQPLLASATELRLRLPARDNGIAVLTVQNAAGAIQ